MAMVSSCITMDAVIYGETFSANSDACSNAPPEKRLIIPKMPWVRLEVPLVRDALLIAFALTKGT